ncbi:MAG TPA: oligosaccharide flippase family protein [Gemmatimonadaceae bacterium]|nr:oligosaccharide flippase family protein [Gemmatimonadaceae bacterium]
MRIQLAWTIFTEFLVMLSGALVLKFAASLLGPAGFGEYALGRRVVGLVYLPLIMGLGIAAPRYIAIARTAVLKEYAESSFAFATFTAGLFPVLIVALAMNLTPSTFSRLIFGSSSHSHLIAPASLALVGLTLHSLVYAVHRGRSEMRFANALQMVNLGVMPIAAFALGERTAAGVIGTMGLAWVVVAGAALLHLAYLERDKWPGVVSIRQHLRVLLRFGLPRVPGEFALVGIFALPALIAVRTQGLIVAGQFSAAMSLLTITSGVFAPVGLVILPRASAQAASGDIAGVRRLVIRILVGGTFLSVAGVILGEVLIPPFIRWYFGPAFTPGIPVFRACLLGAVPYVVYVLMRNILDALDVRPINARNLTISLAVLVLLCLVRSNIMWMAWSLTGSLTLLGALTLREVYVRLGSPIDTVSVPLAAEMPT